MAKCRCGCSPPHAFQFSVIIASIMGTYTVFRAHRGERENKTFGVIPESFNTMGGGRIRNGWNDHASIDLAIHSTKGTE